MEPRSGSPTRARDRAVGTQREGAVPGIKKIVCRIQVKRAFSLSCSDVRPTFVLKPAVLKTKFTAAKTQTHRKTYSSSHNLLYDDLRLRENCMWAHPCLLPTHSRHRARMKNEIAALPNEHAKYQTTKQTNKNKNKKSNNNKQLLFFLNQNTRGFKTYGTEGVLWGGVGC